MTHLANNVQNNKTNKNYQKFNIFVDYRHSHPQPQVSELLKEHFPNIMFRCLDPHGGALFHDGAGGGAGGPGGRLQPLHHWQQREVHPCESEGPAPRLLLPHPPQQ